MDGNPGGSAPLAMTCSARIAMCAAVKIRKLAGANIHRADAQTNIIGFVNAIEVDQSLEGALESGRIVVADAFVRREPMVQLPRNEKSGLTKRQGHQYVRWTAGKCGINGGTCHQNKVNERPRVSTAAKPIVG